MKYIQSIMAILLVAVTASCTDMKGDSSNGSDGGDNKPKKFASMADAAVAAKEDMIAASETVDFGVNKEKLRTAEPGNAIYKYEIEWNALMKADSNTTLENITGKNPVTIVPLVTREEVVTVISLMEDNGEYGIGGLGDRQLSTELDMVRRADSLGMVADITVYEIPNLQVTVYGVKGSNRYYTSYNNNSIRQGLEPKQLVEVLKADARRFEKMYGDDLRKGDLVR